MATYAQLHELMHDSNLIDKVEIAVIVAAQGIVNGGETNQVQRNKWAAQAFKAPRYTAKNILPAVLAKNKDLSVTAIQGAGDSAIQANVDEVINLFADLITDTAVI